MNTEEFNNKVKELDEFFSSFPIQKSPIKLNNHTTILDYRGFVVSHMKVITNQNPSEAYIPCLDRLFELKNLLH